MAGVLIPSLCPLDERVLAALDTWRGRRPITVAELVHGERCWRCTACAREAPVSEHTRRAWKASQPIQCISCLEAAGWDADARVAVGQTLRPVRVASPEQVQEVREVLRCLERVGRAYQAGGWWRRTPT